MTPNDDHLLRRHAQRPRRADARARARRRRRRADARLRAPHDAARAATASSSRSTRPRRCWSAAPAGSATSTSSAASSSAPRPARASKWLAEQEQADIVVFGSDYRTAAGHVAPQRSAQTLLEGGPAAVAIAPANYRADRDAADPHDRRARRAGRRRRDRDRPRARRGARRDADRDERHVDLLVVGSRAEAPEGRVMITSQAQNAIENSTAPVLVVARGVPLVRFAARRVAGLSQRIASARAAAAIVAPRADACHLRPAPRGAARARRPAPPEPLAAAARRDRRRRPARAARATSSSCWRGARAGDGDRRAGPASDRRRARPRRARSWSSPATTTRPLVRGWAARGESALTVDTVDPLTRPPRWRG